MGATPRNLSTVWISLLEKLPSLPQKITRFPAKLQTTTTTTLIGEMGGRAKGLGSLLKWEGK